MNESQVGFLRTAAKRKLLNFCQVIDQKYEAAWFHEVIADCLEKALVNTKEGKKTRIILSIPPRHGKSQLASIYFPAWALGKHPTLKFILSTYGAELSEEIGMKTRDVIRSPEYGAIFPEIELRQDTKAKAKWQTNKGGSFTAVGVGGAVTGRGADIIICDDLHKDRAEAESETVRSKVWDYYRSTLYSRLEGFGAVIVIMQRWHTDDLVGKLLEDQERLKIAGEAYDDWEVINFPAIADDDEFYEDKLVRSKGQSLWDKKFPIPVLDNIRQVAGVYGWACTPSETPILMEDFTYKKIKDVKKGDKIIGFETGTSAQRSKLVVTEVKSTFSKEDFVYNLEMSSGRTVRCTEDHKWFTGRLPTEKEPNRKKYAPVKKGGSLLFVSEPLSEITERERFLWGYLAGIVDGEGSIKRGVLDIHQSVERHPLICKKITAVLDELGLKYITEIRKRSDKNPAWSDCQRWVVHNIRDVYPKLIHYGESAKSEEMIEVLIKHGHCMVREKDRVISMEKSETETVYALETGTGNYIAWGYASSNSQYQQDPVLSETQEFKTEYFKYITEEELQYKYLRYYTLVDPAISQKKEADNTVVLTVGKEVSGPNIYRIREDAGKFTPQQTIDLIFKHQEDFKGSRMFLETVAYQKALKYSIEEEQRRRGIYFSVNELRADNKDSRIRGLLPLYQAGVIYHRKSDVEYERELLQFPRGKHDDRADAMSYTLFALHNTENSSVTQFKQKLNGYFRSK